MRNEFDYFYIHEESHTKMVYGDGYKDASSLSKLLISIYSKNYMR